MKVVRGLIHSLNKGGYDASLKNKIMLVDTAVTRIQAIRDIVTGDIED